MFKELLVPVDFSETSARALRLAISLARVARARITLLYVGTVPDSPAAPDPELEIPDAVHQLELRQAEDERSDLVRLAEQEIPDDVPWRTVKRVGDPAREILAELGASAYDLVVIGSHGRTGVRRMVLGSVSDAVLHAAPVPVVVTR